MSGCNLEETGDRLGDARHSIIAAPSRGVRVSARHSTMAAPSRAARVSASGAVENIYTNNGTTVDRSNRKANKAKRRRHRNHREMQMQKKSFSEDDNISIVRSDNDNTDVDDDDYDDIKNEGLWGNYLPSWNKLLMISSSYSDDGSDTETLDESSDIEQCIINFPKDRVGQKRVTFSLENTTVRAGARCGVLNNTTAGAGARRGVLKNTTAGAGARRGALKNTTAGAGARRGVLKNTAAATTKRDNDEKRIETNDGYEVDKIDRVVMVYFVGIILSFTVTISGLASILVYFLFIASK